MVTNVYLVQTPEMEEEKFWNVFNLLDSVKGSFVFLIKKDHQGVNHPLVTEEVDDRLHPKPWEYFFRLADAYRQKHDIGVNEYVCVLTDRPNNLNWFSAADYDGRRNNLFVHCADWDYFSKGSDVRYPIAYHVAITLLHHHWLKSTDEIGRKVHMEQPQGCINDFCANKNEVHIKMRTGDICDACLEDIIDTKVDKSIIKHVLDIIGQISGFMRFSKKWKIEVKLPILSIEGRKREFRFLDYGGLRLSSAQAPLQARVLYEIIYDAQIDKKHLSLNDFLYNQEVKNKFIDAYLESRDFIPEDEEVRADKYKKVVESIESICDAKNERITQLISRLNSAFDKALGKELSEKYKISREDESGNVRFFYSIGKDKDASSLDYIQVDLSD